MATSPSRTGCIKIDRRMGILYDIMYARHACIHICDHIILHFDTVERSLLWYSFRGIPLDLNRHYPEIVDRRQNMLRKTFTDRTYLCITFQ